MRESVNRAAVSCPASAQLAATTLYVWNPYVAERLGIGHWPLLLAYGYLPRGGGRGR